mmetsp:Transcript_25412/g.69877  ORF Transcript_25412/g.69877 Transcript_25412/m.69877 type:complete len:207 (+) Transcript_25412:40-660(+)
MALYSCVRNGGRLSAPAGGRTSELPPPRTPPQIAARLLESPSTLGYPGALSESQHLSGRRHSSGWAGPPNHVLGGSQVWRAGRQQRRFHWRRRQWRHWGQEEAAVCGVLRCEQLHRRGCGRWPSRAGCRQHRAIPVEVEHPRVEPINLTIRRDGNHGGERRAEAYMPRLAMVHRCEANHDIALPVRRVKLRQRAVWAALDRALGRL